MRPQDAGRRLPVGLSIPRASRKRPSAPGMPSYQPTVSDEEPLSPATQQEGFPRALKANVIEAF